MSNAVAPGLPEVALLLARMAAVKPVNATGQFATAVFKVKFRARPTLVVLLLKTMLAEYVPKARLVATD